MSNSMKASRTKPAIAKGEVFSYPTSAPPWKVDLTPFIREFGLGVGKAEGDIDIAMMYLNRASRMLNRYLDYRYPRVKRDPRREAAGSFENFIWANILVLTCWLSCLIHQKQIWHYGAYHEGEGHLLYLHILPSILDAADQGILEAVRLKTMEGRMPKIKAAQPKSGVNRRGRV